jgi:hypothetical protein
MIFASSFTLATLQGQRGCKNMYSRDCDEVGSSPGVIDTGAGDMFPAVFAYAASSPIPVAAAATQRASSVQVRQRRSVPTHEGAVSLFGPQLFEDVSITFDP